MGATGTDERLPEAFWTVDVATLQRLLNAPPEGLSAKEARRRLKKIGPNASSSEPEGPLRRELARLLANPLVGVLALAAAVSAGAGDWLNAVIITTMVGLGLGLDALQSHRSLRAAEALRCSVALRATVRRGGGWLDVATAELVPGDRIRLAAGDLVPADVRLLVAHDVMCDQAALTGESAPVGKRPVDEEAEEVPLADAASALFAGSSVIAGSAEALVVRTGAGSMFGRLTSVVRAEPPPTAFERGLAEFSALVLRLVGLLIAFVVLALGLVRHDPLEALMFAIALAVGMTPEFMPLILTITLSRGAVSMAKEGVIVKHLRAIENLGAMTVLCTDKTGTLTEGRTLLEASVDAAGRRDPLPLVLGRWGADVASAAHHPLEAALRATEGLRPPPPWEGWRVVDDLPFDAERRRASIVLAQEGERRLVTRGAPEAVLPLCDTCAANPLTPAALRTLEQRVQGWGQAGLRVLAVAWRPLPGARDVAMTDEQALHLVGFLLFRDPPRPDAASAVAALAADGVRVVMLSGDQAEVAAHVGEAVGLRPGRVVRGPELWHVRDDALPVLTREVSIFARLTPEQKTRVVEALRQAGEVVGFVGDGINDAPALRRADVGISVDSAVDVAREAAAIILTRADLGALHRGVIEGRRSFANVGKYVLMGTASNFGNMLSMAAAAVFLPFLPLLPVQVLLNNLLYDLAQVTLPADHVDREAIARPGRWSVDLISRFMRQMGPLSSAFDLATFAVLWGAFEARPELFRTGWFIESLWTQTLVVFVVRTRRSPAQSRPAPALVATVLITCAGALALPYTPLGPLLGFEPPPVTMLATIAALTVAYLWLAELLKQRFFRRWGEDAGAQGPHSHKLDPRNQRARRDSNARPPA